MGESSERGLDWELFPRHMAYGSLMQLPIYFGNGDLTSHMACFLTTCMCFTLASIRGDEVNPRKVDFARRIIVVVLWALVILSIALNKTGYSLVYHCLSILAYYTVFWCSRGREDVNLAGEHLSVEQAKLSKLTSAEKDNITEQDRQAKRNRSQGLLVAILALQMATGIAINIDSYYKNHRCHIQHYQIDDFTYKIQATGKCCDLTAQARTLDQAARQSLRQADEEGCGARCVLMYSNDAGELTASVSIAPASISINPSYCGVRGQIDTCVLGPFQG